MFGAVAVQTYVVSGPKSPAPVFRRVSDCGVFTPPEVEHTIEHDDDVRLLRCLLSQSFHFFFPVFCGLVDSFFPSFLPGDAHVQCKLGTNFAPQGVPQSGSAPVARSFPCCCLNPHVIVFGGRCHAPCHVTIEMTRSRITLNLTLLAAAHIRILSSCRVHLCPRGQRASFCVA